MQHELLAMQASLWPGQVAEAIFLKDFMGGDNMKMYS